MKDNFIDELLKLFHRKDRYISKDVPLKNGKEPTKEQLQMINIIEHNRLEAYFMEKFPDGEYKNMPFYKLAQNLNVRHPRTPKEISIDVQKDRNVLFIEIKTTILTLTPETINLLKECDASVMFNFFKRINEAMLSFAVPLFPDDETTKKE